jgi:hypothetical protein
MEATCLNWNGWSLDRVVIIFSGIVFLIIFIQVTLFHYRQNFRHWSMWIPVLATPIFGFMLILLAFYHALWLVTLLTILLWVGVVAGLFGTYMHIHGVGQRVDGYKLRNFLVGPPLALPGLITGMSVLGLIAMHWG